MGSIRLASPLLTLPALLHSPWGPLFPADCDRIDGLSMGGCGALGASRETERTPQPASCY